MGASPRAARAASSDTLAALRARTDIDGLLELPTIRDAASRRAIFRQALTNLGRGGASFGPSPFDGVPEAALVRAVRTAIDAKLFDDLDWLSPDAVGVALYEFGAALPNGTEKRELGRRLFARLTEGTAETFVAIATRMARSRKGLSGAGVRARVSLVFSTPASAVDAGPLAFALVSRRELAREWITSSATGALPTRRLAARILERAAVAAALRALDGDEYAPRVFATEHISRAFERLLADREPLVWRHAAAARGVLAGVSSLQWKAVVDNLHPRMTPTEWRRGAVSMVAAIASAPDRALPRAHDIVKGGLAQADSGLVATMVYGLPRALDAEPEAAEELLDAIVDGDPNGAAESIAAIMREVAGDAGRRAIATARAVLADRLAHGIEDQAEFMIARALSTELDPERSGDATLRDGVTKALAAFVDEGARSAYTAAVEALEIARINMSTLEGLSQGHDPRGIAMRTSVLLLRDLDLGLLEEPALGHLLHLGADREEADTAIEHLHDRLGRWLMGHERHPPSRDSAAIGMSARRLRALLHLIDTEGTEDDDEAHTATAHNRRVEAAALLFARLGLDPHSPLHRTISATLARSLDALVREGVCDAVDLMLIASSRVDELGDVSTLAEASMNPDVEAVLNAWSKFMRLATEEEAVPLISERTSTPPFSMLAMPPARTEDRSSNPTAVRIEAILELAAALGDDGSGRAEGLRAVLVRIARALKLLAALTSRRAIDDAATTFDALAGAAHAWAQMEKGARLRVLGVPDDDEAPTSTVAVAQAGRLSAQLLRMSDPIAIDARAAASDALGDLRQLLPPPLTRIVADIIARVVELPYEEAGPRAPTTELGVPSTLPAWLGPRRTIGGFYVVRPLGGGAAASVFIAKRLEERQDPNAEQFALKVPDYDGAAARSLSEQEFLAFFRAEATALLGLPTDPNLARFVTFDLAARPKPILVMELIEGPTLERFVAASHNNPHLTAGRAFELLDGVLAGLDVMHRHAVGHLDLKPSNVVLRHGRTPTLVDFGLAGRVIRPGCATGSYGAPEVWGVLPDDFRGEPSPMAADVYAFGALAYEVLTGDTLFDGPNEVAIVSRHLVHDGHPPELDRLAQVRPLVELLEHTLRRDPRQRWSVGQIRRALHAISKVAGEFQWPLAAA